LAGLDDAALREIAEGGTEEEAGSAQVLMRQDEAGDFALVLLSGEVDVLVETPLGANRVSVVGPGDLLGEMGVLGHMPRSATAVSRTPVRMVRLERAALLALVDRRPQLAGSIIRGLSMRLHDVLTPLSYLMHAANALEKDEFPPELLDAFAQQAGAISPFAQSFARMVKTLTARRNDRQEMGIAARLQAAMLPKRFPSSPRVAIDARMLPARAVGGDFFDAFRLADDRLVVAVADVSGKGVPAAFLMGVARTALRAECRAEGARPDRILARINALLSEDNDQQMFVSLFLAILDECAGTLDWANAGHPAGLYISQGAVTLLQQAGPVLGINQDAGFSAASLSFRPTDRLFLYTDGISEALNERGDFFGEERVTTVLAGLGDHGPDAANDAVIAAVQAFSGGATQADDITCLCLDRLT
jgi:sigma-B regulation protein RsbU (phosphoserine phosphatase)